jgi:putative tricarboxylic transport membrane protein
MHRFTGGILLRRLLRDSDVVAGALLAALGAFIVSESVKWEYMGFDGPGPGFFPFWYGLAITALSLSLALVRVRKLKTETAAGADWPAIGRALATWAVFVVAVALMRPLGFVLSFALLTLVLVRVQFGRPWTTACLAAIGLAAGFYILFPLALDVPLPTGWLGL